MSQKLNLSWLGIVAMGVVLSAVAQEKPADFATQVPLSVTGEGPWYRLELPLSVQPVSYTHLTLPTNREV